MKVIEKDFELDSLSYFKAHLGILNALLPIHITHREVEILSHFWSLPVEVRSPNMFCTEARREVSKVLGLNGGSMSNHLKNMRKKGLLLRDGDYFVIAPALLPSDSVQSYRLKLVRLCL